MLAAPELEVARAVEPGAAQNACNTTEVLVDRIQICYRNVTFAELPAPDPSATPDPSAPPPVAHRDLVPLDTDVVKLFAIVWAREPDEEEFKPYCGDAGFDNDGSYWRCGEIKGSPKFNHGALRFFEMMQQEKLDPAITRVEAWRWPCHTLRFDWQELVIHGRSHKNEADKSVRSYEYDDPADVEVIEGEDEHGWVVTPVARAGTRRFIAQVTLPAGVWNRRVKRKHRKPGGTLVTRRTNGQFGFLRGWSLRLSVRKAAVPQARSNELTEMLRWATAFIGTPYENGGHWLGGRAGASVPQSGNGIYGGHGFDCNGFIECCADLAGIDWALKRKARHGTLYKYRHGDAAAVFPGVEVAAGADLQPGDLLDLLSSSHVALVYEVYTNSEGRQRVRIIDSSGSQQGVSIHTTGDPTATIHTDWQLVNMSDPQKRPWKEGA